LSQEIFNLITVLSTSILKVAMRLLWRIRWI